MQILDQAQAIALLDGFACALLAASCSAKASKSGAHFTGSAVLGFICGICGPLLREILLHGQAGTQVVIKLLPDDVFLGSVAGIFATKFSIRLPVAFWLDALAVSLVSVLGCILAMQELGIVGGLCLGMIAAFLPGVIRDVALGDIADIVESKWYATSAVLGCLAGMAVFMAPFFVSSLAFMENRLVEISVLTGAALAFGLQLWKRKFF